MAAHARPGRRPRGGRPCRGAGCLHGWARDRRGPLRSPRRPTAETAGGLRLAGGRHRSLRRAPAVSGRRLAAGVAPASRGPRSLVRRLERAADRSGLHAAVAAHRAHGRHAAAAEPGRGQGTRCGRPGRGRALRAEYLRRGAGRARRRLLAAPRRGKPGDRVDRRGRQSRRRGSPARRGLSPPAAHRRGRVREPCRGPRC